MTSPFFSLRAWIRVSGEDATDFLQSQSAQDLRIDIGSAVFSLWLNHQGKIQASGWVLRVGESTYEIISLTSSGVQIFEHLDRHIIADEVELDDFSADAVACLERLQASSDPNEGTRWNRLSEVCGSLESSRWLQGNRLWFARGDEAESILQSKADALLAESEILPLRLKTGLGLIPEELGDSATPIEASFGDEAFSLRKGCYLGQEVVARMDRLDRVLRRWVKIEGVGNLPGAGDAVCLVDGAVVGEVSAAHEIEERDGAWMGRAWVKTKALQSNLLLGLHGTDAKPSSINVVDD